ncbi:hypothetical protein HAX54_015706 [Datura stramonium]|uniref:Uncharacterized protein n=1 Tax=Datura stramonium TaxID=4076 RepID=A0ABS8UIU3_DATST|nr:hypothetical protein [Datura stramonium]
MADGKEVGAAQVDSIFIYPLKSCRGISVSEAALSSNADALARISLDLVNLTMRQDQMEEARDKAMGELREALMTS